jgi:hypothetical protein
MKRFLIPLAAVLLLATGCTKEYVTKQYVTQQVIGGMDMSLIDFEVKSENWTQRTVQNGNDDEGYFEAILQVPEITDEVIQQGLVLVYERLEGGNNSIWTPLPAQSTQRDIVDNQPFNYTTFTDFEYQKGQVNVYVTTTDLYAGMKPGTKYFRVAVQL